MTHDNEFVFKALGNEYTVNSKLAFDFNINFMYRYFENNHITILPKAGIGLEYIGTGIKFYDEETEEPSSYNVSTMHTNIGVMALIPVFLRNYAGIEVSYHYCPYGWSKGIDQQIQQSGLHSRIAVSFLIIYFNLMVNQRRY